MSKKTAVEWLTEQIAYKNYYGNLKMWHKYGDLDQIINEAKAMEKEQIMKAVYDSMGVNFDPNMGRAEQYYNETYGGEQ